MSDVLNDLVPILQEYLTEARTDQVHTKELINKLDATIDEMQKCAVQMKLQIRSLEDHSTSVSNTLDIRAKECGNRFEKMEGKIDQGPSSDLFARLNKDIEDVKNNVQAEIKEIKKEIKELLVTVTKWSGGIVVLVAVLGYVIPVLLKKIGG
jgi:chromosome segregation ATPase